MLHKIQVGRKKGKEMRMEKENFMNVFGSLLMIIFGIWLYYDGSRSEASQVEGWIAGGMIAYGLIRIYVTNRSAKK